MLPLDDSRDHRIMQIHLPWLRFQDRYDLRPGDKVHEVNAPMLMGGFRMVATFAEGLAPDAGGVLCEQGDWSGGWAWFLGGGQVTWIVSWSGHEHRITAPIDPGASVVAVDGVRREDGGMDLRLRVGTSAVDGVLPIPFPLAIAPDGAFLTVGYGRPFPVCDDYAPPAAAPPSLTGVRIDVGVPPLFDLDDEVAHAMRHQ